MFKIIPTILLGIVAIVGFFFPNNEINFGARTDGVWNDHNTYLSTVFSAGRNILINGSNKYLNFNTTSGSSGYGFRDNSGSVEFKHSGGSWAAIGTGGSGTTINQLGQIGDVATTTPMSWGDMLRYNTTTSEWESVATSTLGLGGSSDTVSSVDMSVPTGLSIAGNPITDSGTLALTFDTGYSIPLTASTTEGSTAYTWGNHTLGGYLSASSYYATTTHANISSLPALSITKSQVSDFGTYLTAESDPVWTGVSGNYLLTANAFTQAIASTTFVDRADWTTHDSYPAACTNQFIRQIGDTNTCASVATTDFASANISQWTNDSGYWNLASSTIPVNKGGTGAITLTGVLKGNGTSAFTAASNGTDFTLTTAQSCTNQVITALTASGASTCSSVSNAMLSNSTISGVALGSNLAALTNDATLNGSSYNGSGAISDWGLNLGNANTWTALQTFGNASTTQISSTGSAYFATTSGNVGIGTTSPGAKLQVLGAIQSGDLTDGVVLTNGTGVGSVVGYASGAYNNLDLRATSGVGTGLYLPSTGNVGIGTTGPNTKLEVYGTASSTIMYTDTLTLLNPLGAAYGGTGGNFSASTGVLTFNSGVASAVATSTNGLKLESTIKVGFYDNNATSTAWTGTSTRQILVRATENYNSISCKTSAGTLNVNLLTGSTRSNMIIASTTAGTTALTTNNSFTNGSTLLVEAGTPVSSPTQLFCWLSFTRTFP
jgi:hypothetical protein